MRSYSIRFDNVIDRESSEQLRDAWLRELERFPEFSKFTGEHRYKKRTIFKTSIEHGSIYLTHHEWGIELIFFFAFGVTSTIAATVMLRSLKTYIRSYKSTFRNLDDLQSGRVHITINLENSYYGPIKIAVIDGETTEFLVTESKLKKILSNERGFERIEVPRAIFVEKGEIFMGNKNVDMKFGNSTIFHGDFVVADSIERSFNKITNNTSAMGALGLSEIAKAFNEVTRALTATNEITEERKSILLEHLEELSKQATLPESDRVRPSVIRAIIADITTGIGAAGGLAEVWSTWGNVLTRFFGL